MKTLTLTAVAAVLAVSAPATGFSQELVSSFKRDKNVSVRERPRPDYEAAGVKASGFTVYPRISVDAVHDDNVFAVATGEQSDTIWRVKPEVAVRSDWSQHALGAFASASINRYSDFDNENTEDYTLGLNGRLDVQRGANVAVAAQWQKLTEARTGITAGTSAGATPKPVEYYLWLTNLTAVKEVNRLRLTGKLGTKRFDYDDQGAAFDQNTRDRDEYYYGGKAEYAVSPDTALFASLIGNKKSYDLDSAALRARDSDGYIATLGANFDLSQVIRGEVEAGYMAQSYKNYSDINGFTAKGNVDWFPTELTTVSATGSRSIEESVAIGAQGFISNVVSVTVDHELMRNVLLSAGGSYGKDNYKIIDRDDKRTGATASATYLVNRRVGVILTYNYLKQKSSGADAASSFTDNKIAASVAVQF